MVTALPKTRGVTGPLPDTASLVVAIRKLDWSAGKWAGARDAALGGTMNRRALTAANEKLRQVERALTRPEGLSGRPWLRNLIFASDRDNGYADVPFPSIIEAWRAGDADLTREETSDLADRLKDAADRLSEAADALTAR
jgi:N-acetylated-alpha-linked acidic dipeptidase